MKFKDHISLWLHHLNLKTEPPLSGVWERFDDHFSGCRMFIGSHEPQDTGHEARLTHVPRSMAAFGWHSMDLKCKDIRRVGACRYSALELFKEMDLLTGYIFSFYVPATLNLLSANLLQVRSRHQLDNSVLHNWRRVEDQDALPLIRADDTN